MSQIVIMKNKIFESKEVELSLNLIVKNDKILEDIFITFENKNERQIICKNDFEVKQFIAFVREFSRKNIGDFEENHFLKVASRQLKSGDPSSLQKSLSLKDFEKVYISKADSHTCISVFEDAIKGFSKARRSRQNSLSIYDQDPGVKRIQYINNEVKDIYQELKAIYVNQYQKGSFNESLELVCDKNSVLYDVLSM